MSTWRDLAKDNRTAAYELETSKRHRSSVSRAYYAVYSRVTEELVRIGLSMPAGMHNPQHQALPNLIGFNLSTISAPRRWRLSGIVRRLFRLRVIADYVPETEVASSENTIALGPMREALSCLEGRS